MMAPKAHLADLRPLLTNPRSLLTNCRNRLSPRRLRWLGVLLCAVSLLMLGEFLSYLQAHRWFETLHIYGEKTDVEGNRYSLLSEWSGAERRFVTAYCGWVLPATLLLSVGMTWSLGRRMSLDWLKRSVRLRVVARWLLPVLATAEALLSSHLLLRQTPLTDDEQAYLFQARIMSTGRLYLPSQAPVPRPHFDNVFIVNSGTWFTQYPFGHSLFLTPGVLLGDPYLMPALLTGASAALTIAIAEQLFGALTALLAGGLLTLSPFFILTGSTLLSHSSTTMLALFFVFLTLRGLKTHSDLSLALAGVALGMQVHVRPHLTALFGGPVGLVLLIHGAAEQRAAGRGRWYGFWAWSAWRPLVTLGLGAALPVLVYFGLNYWINGDPLITNYDAYWEPSYTRKEFDNTTVLGFGAYPWGIVHTPGLGWRNTWLNFVRMLFWLVGNPLILVPLALSARDLNNENRWWLLAFLLLTPFFLGFHYFYFWPGVNDTGPVFYSELIPWLMMLTAWGVRWWHQNDRCGALALPFLIAVTAAGLLCFTPVQIRVLNHLQTVINTPYRKLERWARAHEPGKQLVVFMDQVIQPPGDSLSWVMGRPNPQPDLSDRFLYVLDLGEARDLRLLNYFPSRVPVVLKVRPDREVVIDRLLTKREASRAIEPLGAKPK